MNRPKKVLHSGWMDAVRFPCTERPDHPKRIVVKQDG